MKSTPQMTAPRKKRVSKLDWLNAALTVLRDSGIEAIRIERLAEHLGVSKSGFYYHFGDLPALKSALLDHWMTIHALPMQSPKFKQAKTPAEMLDAIATSVEDLDLGELDLAIRQWATQDVTVKRAYTRIFAQRIEWIRSIVALAGFTGEDLEMRTMTFVGYTSTETQLFRNQTAKTRARHRKLRIAFLLRSD